MIEYLYPEISVYIMRLTKLKRYVKNYHSDKALVLFLDSRTNGKNCYISPKANVVNILGITEYLSTFCNDTKDLYKLIGKWINNNIKNFDFKEKLCIILGIPNKTTENEYKFYFGLATAIDACLNIQVLDDKNNVENYGKAYIDINVFNEACKEINRQLDLI